MNRGEFEARLLRDPQLRRRLEMLEEAAERVRRAQYELSTAAVLRDVGIAALANEGVPLAAIARLVDVTPQRLGVIVRETVDKVRPEISDPDDPEALDEMFQAIWTEFTKRLEQDEQLDHGSVVELMEALRGGDSAQKPSQKPLEQKAKTSTKGKRS